LFFGGHEVDTREGYTGQQIGRNVIDSAPGPLGSAASLDFKKIGVDRARKMQQIRKIRREVIFFDCSRTFFII
jgi:hypothetical protein